MAKKILLVDGNALIFRAFYSSYGRTNLTTKSGIPTNAVYSFINMLFNIIKNNEYFDVKVAFDKGKKTFRHDKLEEYKAGRAKTPPELIQQFPIVREFLSAAKIDWYEVENYEADDIIGTIAVKSKTEDQTEIHILTSDQDMYQLIDDNVFVLSPQTGTSDMLVYDRERLFEKWGVTPEQVIDYKGLRGDSSDNIKGVAGIGEKTAKELLQEFHTLENLYDNIENVKGAKQQKLIADKVNAFLSKEVATIHTDVPNLNYEIRQTEVDLQSLKDFFIKYEMNSLLKKYSVTTQTTVVEVIKPIVLTRWDPKYNDEENYIYLETLDENYHKPDLIGMGISNSKGNFVYLFDLMQDVDILNWQEEKLDEPFQNFLASKKFKTYDVKKTIFCLTNLGYKIKQENFIYDMMIACYVLNSNVKSNFESQVNLIDSGVETKTFEEVFGKGVKRTKLIDKDIKNDYLCSRTLIVKQLEEQIISQLKDAEQWELYQEIEFPLCFVLFAMEQEGVLIDREELQNQTENILELLNTTEARAQTIVRELGFEEVNFASPKQLKELLFDKLGLPDTKKGSTDKEVLESLTGLHPIIDEILIIRRYQKLYSTYLKGFEKFISQDNKVHTIYNQTLTNTGRISSQDPNLQNISVRDPEQRLVRKIFIAEPGYSFLSYDYSQIELRVLADYANEETLIKAYNENVDIHELAARNIFDLKPEEVVNSEQRRIAKVFNFGILYGLTKFGLAKDLKINHFEAQQYIDAYNKTFSQINDYKESIVDFAVNNGFVKTLANRRRYIYELQSSSHVLREFGKRAAVNAPIQGTAADIIKIAMIDVYQLIQTSGTSARLVAQIHDELIIKVKNEEVEDLKSKIAATMQVAFNRLFEIIKIQRTPKVPLSVNGAVGDTWYDLK